MLSTRITDSVHNTIKLGIFHLFGRGLGCSRDHSGGAPWVHRGWFDGDAMEANIEVLALLKSLVL